MLLADRLGYVQLAEPVRFTAAWERAASLRLRQGDPTALDEYDQHGRIRGAPPDQATDQAARAYLATYLTGRTVLLMAADWARCRELSARIRDDLIHLGLVDAGRTIRIADGAQASDGDLIICRANDHHLEAGEPGRALANGDVLRIEVITRRGIMVRRMLGPDPATGQRRFTDRAFRYDGYQSADLAYAVTGHSAQGATVLTGIALVTGAEDRQWLYPAMTRGTDTNLAYVFTTPARPADPQPGTRPAPELDRYERLRRERAGYLPDEPSPGGPDRAGQRMISRPVTPCRSVSTDDSLIAASSSSFSARCFSRVRSPVRSRRRRVCSRMTRNSGVATKQGKTLPPLSWWCRNCGSPGHAVPDHDLTAPGSSRPARPCRCRCRTPGPGTAARRSPLPRVPHLTSPSWTANLPGGTARGTGGERRI